MTKSTRLTAEKNENTAEEKQNISKYLKID